MSVVKGQAFSTGNWNAQPSGVLIGTPEVKSGFAASLTRIMPNGAAPLFLLTSKLKEKKAVRPEHGYFAKIMLFPSVTLTAAKTGISGNTSTTLPVASTAEIIPGMLLRAQDASTVRQHTVLVVAVNSATELQVIPNIGDTALTTIADAMVMQQIGNAMGEGSDRPTSLLTKTIPVNNYTQIFRNTWSISDTVRSTLMDVGDGNVAESRRECAAYHATAIEDAFFFGRKQMLSSAANLGPGQFRTMNGLIELIADDSTYIGGKTNADNIHTAGATTTLTQLETYLEATLDAQSEDVGGSNERVVFVGSHALKVFNNIAKLNTEYDVTTGETEFGLQFRTFKTTRGTFRLIEHALFNRNEFYSKHAVVVDLPSISAAYLRHTKSDDFNMDMVKVDNGIDAVGGTLTTELTLECRNPQGCAVINNLTAALAG